MSTDKDGFYEEPAFDANTGELVKPAQGNKGQNLLLIEWAQERMGSKFMNIGKQAKCIKVMLAAGFTREDIQEKWEELEDDEFWSNKGIDFGVVLMQLSKTKGKKQIVQNMDL